MSQIREVFPSLIYRGRLSKSSAFNKELKREIGILSSIDGRGIRWSRENYKGGYSSYGSETQLHHTSPHFAELKNSLRLHVKKYVAALEWDLMGKKIEMTTCWVNQMEFGTHHTMHLHPLSAISGVYFVDAPPGSSCFKMEDPRMGLFMAAPPRKTRSRNKHFLEFDPNPGEFLLFESWMKHEVPPHRGKKPRLSVSFNYEWI